jgi:FkbM family methyltransferase
MCPLVPKSCDAPEQRDFLEKWRMKLDCWLCPDQSIIDEAMHVAKPISGNLHQINEHSCVSHIILSLYLSTRSYMVQFWPFYKMAMELVNMCHFNNQEFFDLFEVTPDQVRYALMVIAHQFGIHAQIQVPHEDSEERLIIDCGMGLGADTRYYLSQGYSVVAIEANPSATEVVRANFTFLRNAVTDGRLTIMNAAVGDESFASIPFYAFGERPEHSSDDIAIHHEGGEKHDIRQIDCADLIKVFGTPFFMKVDVERATLRCIESVLALVMEHGAKARPRYLSLELEGSSWFADVLHKLAAAGYRGFKIVRQYVYSPSPCENQRYTTSIWGCGSGPFGENAVDYTLGLKWRPLEDVLTDPWADEFGGGLDWFDLHATADPNSKIADVGEASLRREQRNKLGPAPFAAFGAQAPP